MPVTVRVVGPTQEAIDAFCLALRQRVDAVIVRDYVPAPGSIAAADTVLLANRRHRARDLAMMAAGRPLGAMTQFILFNTPHDIGLVAGQSEPYADFVTRCARWIEGAKMSHDAITPI